VLALDGPAELGELIDSIERSLFIHGVITARIEAGVAETAIRGELLEAVESSYVQSGLLVLVVTPAEANAPSARVENEQITLDTNNLDQAVADVHELLQRAGILVSRGNVDWEI
jgi:hypothetical protein